MTTTKLFTLTRSETLQDTYKGSWPELVGVKGKIIVIEGETYVITNYDCLRVWVWVDKDDGLVTKPPIIG
ncbi:unnamed protein product [Malus baccata var. baccata]